MRFDLIFIEIAAIVLFIVGYIEFKKSGKGRGLEFLMMGVYGFLLEVLDMFIFKSYAYSEGFFLSILGLPVCIALLWAVILAGAMTISDYLHLPEKLKPFMDAILAVWVDLALDAIAIRLGYWTWNIPITEGWFGVPAGNLYAWMWVAFAFSLSARWVRRKVRQDEKWLSAYFATPFISYVVLFVSMVGVGIVGNLAGLQAQNERLIIFFIQFAVFCMAICIWWKKRVLQNMNRPISGFWKWTRYSMHLYFLAAYFIIGLHRELPVLGILAFLILALEVLFHRLIFLQPPKRQCVKS